MTELGDIYRRAAEVIDRWPHATYCCFAIAYAEDGLYGLPDKDFLSLFAPPMVLHGGYFWPRDEAHRPVRVTALLLMAAMADAGDLG